MTTWGLAKKATALPLIATFFAVMGTGYAYVYDTLAIEGAHNTSSLALDYTGMFTNDDGQTTGGRVDLDDLGGPVGQLDLHNGASSADPKAPGPKGTSGSDPLTARYGVDVARCSAIDEGTRVLRQRSSFRTPTLDTRAPPGSTSRTAALSLSRSRASGLTSGDEGAATLAGSYPEALDLGGSNQGDIEVDVQDITPCQQINPGETVRITIHQRVSGRGPSGERPRLWGRGGVPAVERARRFRGRRGVPAGRRYVTVGPLAGSSPAAAPSDTRAHSRCPVSSVRCAIRIVSWPKPLVRQARHERETGGYPFAPSRCRRHRIEGSLSKALDLLG